MTGQDAQVCTTCRIDPSTAPGRYCASLACRCGHPACPAVASWVPREGQGVGDANRHKERIYFSPACIDLNVPDLFDFT